MNSIYRLVGVSKQAFHQRITRQMSFAERSNLLLEPIKGIRKNHPRMSSRMMYLRLAPQHLGRDRFEAFCFENGFKVPIKRSFQKTTNSLGVTRFDNLLRDYKVTGINQVWVSDITYYRIGEKFYYLTFILDLYSRYIVGYSTSTDLSTENTTLPALRMALKGRHACNGLIIHSDGGGQYYCKEWLSITRKREFRNSMCDNVYENPHAERINGTIKNDYLIPWGPENYAQLIAMNKKVVMLYNTERPHQSIGNITPAQFEKALEIQGLKSKRCIYG
jgi:putative transposase